MRSENRFALAFGVSVTAPVATTALHYNFQLPPIVLALGLLGPVVLATIYAFRSWPGRIAAFIPLAALSWLVGFMTAFALFDDGP